MDEAYKLLGLKEHASPEDIDKAYTILMKKNKEEQFKNSENRKSLISAYNTLNNNYMMQLRNQSMGFGGLWNSFFNFDNEFTNLDDLSSIPSSSNNESFYYSKESVATVKDGKLLKKTRENNNGNFREFEEYQDLNNFRNTNRINYKN